MGVLVHSITIFHQFGRCVAGWHLTGLLDGETSLHLWLHELPLLQLEVGVLVELLVEDETSFRVNLHTIQIANILSDEPLYREYGYFLTSFPVQLLALRPVIEPCSRCKIDGFTDIEACGEASMVWARHREDILTRPLQCLEYLDLLLFKIGRRDHSNDVQQYIWVFLEEQWYFLLNGLFELFSVALRHTVPLFGLTPVRVIYREEHQVLIVPAEGRVAHPNVEPWYIYAGDVVAPWELHQWIEGLREVIQIPRMVEISLLILADYPLTRSAKPRAKFTCGDISRIFDPGALANIILYHVPVTLLQLVEVFVRPRLPTVRLMLSRELKKLSKCASFIVLLESLALRQVLQHLKASRKLLVRLSVKGQWWFEAGWWDNLYASVATSFRVSEQIVNVDQWIRKLRLGRKIRLHFLDVLYASVDICRLNHWIFHCQLELF